MFGFLRKPWVGGFRHLILTGLPWLGVQNNMIGNIPIYLREISMKKLILIVCECRVASKWYSSDEMTI